MTSAAAGANFRPRRAGIWTRRGCCQPEAPGHHVNATVGQPHVLRAVIGGVLFLTARGLLAFGLSMIVRHPAAAL